MGACGGHVEAHRGIYKSTKGCTRIMVGHVGACRG